MKTTEGQWAEEANQAKRKEDLKASIKVIQAIAETIREVKRVPSGHLYAMLMNRMSLDTYNTYLSILVQAGVIEVVNHEIIWKEQA